MMHIAMIAMGSQGDVQPYVALGKGLKEAGHQVRVLTHENYRDFVTSQGLEFYPARGNVQDVVESEEMQKLLEKGNFLAINAHTAKLAKQAALDWAEDGLSACRDVDLLVAGVGGLYLAVSLAEKLKIPLRQAFVFPFTPTRMFPGVLLPQSLRLGGTFNRLSHRLVRQIMWQASRTGDTLARKQVLGLAAAPFGGPYSSKVLGQHPVLYGFSPSVVMATDWDNARVTGYWFLETASNWSPPSDLIEFLQAGSKPIYVGFGSMGSRKPEETAQIILDALKQTKQRAIMLSGWGGLKTKDLPATVYVGKSIPHSWLFSKVAAVVHHGGAGTTAAGLRAGVPSIIIPFFGDQPFWGQRVSDLAVGSKPIPRKQLTASKLAEAIQFVLTNNDVVQRAAALGQKIRSEKGIENAVADIQKGVNYA